MKTLIEITEDMQALDELLAEMGGDVTEDSIAEYIDKLFAETEEAFNEKADRYLSLIKSKTATAKARKELADDLAKRAKAEANAADFLKHRLHMAMQQRGIAKAGIVFTASVSKNGGKTPIEMDIDPSKLPDAYRIDVTEHKADDQAIRAALDSGEKLPFAKYGQRGTHLRVC